MESAQSILTWAIYAIWYAFSTLIIFDFLIGLPALMQQAAMKNTTSETQATQAVDQKQSKHSTLNSTSTRAISNADEATIEYLQMVGADLKDFDSIQEARQFLDEHAPWTIENSSTQTQQLIINTEAQEKLTCVQVQAEFAKLGWAFQKHRTGHFRYRVNVEGLIHKFKTLQDALDWLDVSKRLIQVAARH